ncbi:hypothetical protein GCM10022255_113820 [Dactylosporangium darangshiense]|uniref:DDE domain-containing protein n=1 Tax=Dactylosporangium darangshiense TaxID=579108 RepID=A0ABP8DVS4_9ACTN
MVAVRLYLRYNLSCRDVEELLIERGVEVDHVTVFRWVQRFTPLLADAARFCRHAPGDRWFVDETYIKVNGVWRYVYRAVDQDGQVIDVLISTRRDAAAARRLFRQALATLNAQVADWLSIGAPQGDCSAKCRVTKVWFGRPRVIDGCSCCSSRPYSGSALRVTMRSSGSSVTIRKTLPATL